MRYRDNQEAYDMYFRDFDKARAFDEIAALFYDRNFGMATKADLELLMFRYYMEAMIQSNKLDDSNVISYAACSDYKMSQRLGITQQRVRNLKVRKELAYPQQDFHWEHSLAYLLQDERSVKFENGYVKINIPDPNLFYAIQDFVEDCGGYVELHLNRKILEISQEYLLQLAVMLEQKEKQDEILCKVDQTLSKLKVKIKVRKACDMIRTILDIGEGATEVFCKIASMLTPKNPISKIVSDFFK